MPIFEIFEQFPTEFPVLETVLSTIVAFFLAMFWYHPKVMGDKWIEAFEKDSVIGHISPLNHLIIFILWSFSAFIYSFLSGFLTPDSIGALLGLSTFIWVGFILPPILINGLVHKKKLIVMAVDSSYYLAGLYLFAVIHDVL